MKKKNTVPKNRHSHQADEPSWVSDDSPGRATPYTDEEIDLLLEGIKDGILDTQAWKDLVLRIGEEEAERVLRAGLVSMDPNVEGNRRH